MGTGNVFLELHFCLQETSQHDVQELNRILFSALESSLVGTSGSNLIHRLYHGTLVNQIVCKECSNVSERQVCVCDEEALYSLSLREHVWLMFGKDIHHCIYKVIVYIMTLWTIYHRPYTTDHIPLTTRCTIARSLSQGT